MWFETGAPVSATPQNPWNDNQAKAATKRAGQSELNNKKINIAHVFPAGWLQPGSLKPIQTDQGEKMQIQTSDPQKYELVQNLLANYRPNTLEDFIASQIRSFLDGSKSSGIPENQVRELAKCIFRSAQARIMTTQQCAEFLGVSISSITKWRKNYGLPAMAICLNETGKTSRLFFDGNEVINWLYRRFADQS